VAAAAATTAARRLASAEVVSVVHLFTATYVAAASYDELLTKLVDVQGYFAREEAAAFPSKAQQVDDLWLDVLRELVDYVDGERRSSLPEPRCVQRGQLLQCMATTVLCTLPGLAKLMAQTRGWRSPASMKEHLRGVELHRAVQRHGLSAVLLDYFIFPFMLHHPRLPPTREGKPISVETLETLVRSQKISKAMSLARTKHDVEVRGLPAQARPTLHQICAVVNDKFPAPPAGSIPIPCQADLPHQDWETGEVDWGTGTDEQVQERMQRFGGSGVMVDEDELRKSLRVLSKQKSAGVSTVSNTMLRRVFVDGKADTVATVLLPFARMCTSGCVCHDAMQLLQARARTEVRR
jgi:hypothetical protein